MSDIPVTKCFIFTIQAKRNKLNKLQPVYYTTKCAIYKQSEGVCHNRKQTQTVEMETKKMRKHGLVLLTLFSCFAANDILLLLKWAKPANLLLAVVSSQRYQPLAEDRPDPGRAVVH